MAIGTTDVLPNWDPFHAPEDPYPVYKALRDSAPVYRNDEHGFFALSRYEDVQAANRDWQTYSYAHGVDIDELGELLQPGNFLDADPPSHAALRAVVKERFRVGGLRESLTSAIESETRRMLSELDESAEIDFATACAWELPIRIGSHLLGFPMSDCDHLRELADSAFMRIPEGPTGSSAAEQPVSQVRQYFEEQIQQRRERPLGDMLSEIAHAEVDGRSIGDAAAGLASLIFGGSVDTTALTMTNAVNLLATHPEQRAWLAQNPEFLGQAVEEVLRFESPIQVFKRTTTSPVELHGTEIPAGARVFLIYGSANRDERKIERADEFDPRRKVGRHLAFGEGIHHCLGAPLARLEVNIVVRTLLEIAPEYRVIGGERTHGPARGFRKLRIEK